MVVQHRILWLIITLYYVAIVHSTLLNINDAESCDLLCKQCNASAVFADDRCECNLSDDNDKGTECIQRIQREIEAIDLNILSEDSTDEERGVRSILKSRHRLRMGDADKVAQYFINEGPATGHSHFIKAFNAAYDNADSATNSFLGVLDGTNKPENEFYDEISLNSPIFWNTCDSPLHMVPETGSSPAISDVEIPIVGMINPALSYSANMYGAANPLVGSIIHHPYRQGPHHRTLHRTDGLPGQLLYNLFNHHRWSPGHHRPVHYGRSSNDRNPVLISQSRENDDSSTASKDLSATENNTDKPVDQNVAANIPRLSKPMYHSIIPYFFDTNAVYQPIQYQRFNIPYTSYHNPLIKVLHPLTEEYVVQPKYIQYVHGILDPLITAPNPNSYCTNNANVEQKDEVSTDKTVYSNNEQSNNVNNISKAEKNENNKSY